MRISKYHSCENSFLITMFKNDINYSLLAKELCSIDKYNADGLMILKSDPIEVLIYNKDGTEANMCGNGLNCMMHYCYDKFKIYKYLKFKTNAGSFECEMLKRTPFSSCVNLGIGDYYKNIIKEKVIINNKVLEMTAFTLGVLHVIIIVDNFDNINDDVLEIFNHQYFEQKANINFVKIVDENTIEVITYERGVGWSNSCGSGSAASAYILNEYYNLKNNIRVLTPGGVLNVLVDDAIYLTGESTFLLEIECEI